ncbi:MAG: 50S ribosomal protein L15 [Candidatus Omnitrophota bacterium]|nr:50S ribosomal protein L15 [Candidatus Omnitrophota bacterium]MDP3786710.1 50S ribosomal protein L15 [Candidatus Omnitrophota bacterium]
MRLGDIRVPAGATKKKKRVGRGPGSGHGKTSTRGQKGQKSRSGAGIRVGFEGGQMPLIRRIPKRGFTSKFKKIFQIVNLSQLTGFKENSVISPVELCKEGIIKDETTPVKILGDGEVSKPITIKAHAFSSGAAEKIKKAGGQTELISAKGGSASGGK